MSSDGMVQKKNPTESDAYVFSLSPAIHIIHTGCDVDMITQKRDLKTHISIRGYWRRLGQAE